MTQWKWIWLVSMKMQVHSLASLNLGSGSAVSCSVVCRWGSDLALLWPWCRPASTAPNWPLACEPPSAAATALKRQNRRKKKKKLLESNIQVLFSLENSFLFSVCVKHMAVPRLGVESKLQLPGYATAMATLESKLPLWPTPQLAAMPHP